MPRAKPVNPEAPTEPIWWLRALPYGDYRNSNWWRRRRDLFLETTLANHGEKRCELCGITHLNATRGLHPAGRIEITFQIHHKSYKNLGYEPDSDLALLCGPCHNLVHRPNSHAAKHWAELNSDIDLAAAAAEIDPDPVADHADNL